MTLLPMSYNTLTNYFDSIFDDFVTYKPTSRVLSTSPTLNIDESDDQYSIDITIPGIDPNKIEIEVVDFTLQVSYNHDEDSHETKSLRREFSHYSFSRSVTLPKNVDTDSIEATSKNGILTITINKNPEALPKKISIKNLD